MIILIIEDYIDTFRLLSEEIKILKFEMLIKKCLRVKYLVVTIKPHMTN